MIRFPAENPAKLRQSWRSRAARAAAAPIPATPLCPATRSSTRRRPGAGSTAEVVATPVPGTAAPPAPRPPARTRREWGTFLALTPDVRESIFLAVTCQHSSGCAAAPGAQICKTPRGRSKIWLQTHRALIMKIPHAYAFTLKCCEVQKKLQWVLNTFETFISSFAFAQHFYYKFDVSFNSAETLCSFEYFILINMTSAQKYFKAVCRLPNKLAFAIFLISARYILIYLYKLHYGIFEWIINTRAPQR